LSVSTLHIVSFDVPIPPDYGGVIDIYYRYKALKSLGIRLILHCFEYGRGQNHDFKEIADEVYFYKRKKSVLKQFTRLPFIVASRNSEILVDRLSKDCFPIIFEGHHCSGLLNHDKLKGRFKIVRIHNIEWKYYKGLANSSKVYWKKLYYLAESKKLKMYEDNLRNANALFCLNESDLNYYQKLNENTFFLPIGIDFEFSHLSDKIDNFVLFHGNLSIEENEHALRWILDAFKKYKLHKKLIVAGKKPSKKLISYLEKFEFVQLIENPKREEMYKLIESAEIILLISFQNTGTKVKLIQSLLRGNRCIANSTILYGTNLDQFCEVIDNQKQLIDKINTTSSTMISPNLKKFLHEEFNPNIQAEVFLEKIKELMIIKNQKS
jgi:hypothetical protein